MSAPDDDRETLRRVFSCIARDIQRKRRQMGRPVNALTTATALLSPNIAAVAAWRFSIYFMSKRWFVPAMVIYYLNMILFGFDASPYSRVGPGIVIAHLVGTTVHAKFGTDCTLFGRAAVGGKGRGDTGGWRGGPVLGDRVTVGFGGSIITDEAIGDDVTVGAGAWAFSALPAGAVAVGVPAKVVKMKTAEDLAEDARHRGM